MTTVQKWLLNFNAVGTVAPKAGVCKFERDF